MFYINIYAQNSWRELLDNAQKYFEAGKIISALDFAEKARIAGEKEFTKKSKEYSITLTILSIINRKSGNLQNVEKYLLESIEIIEQIEGKNGQQYAPAINQLGLFYAEVEKHQKAISLYENAIKIIENNPKQQEIYLQFTNNLALSYARLNNYEKAHKILNDNITFIEKNKMQKREQGIVTRNIIGEIYKYEGKYASAELNTKIAKLYIEDIYKVYEKGIGSFNFELYVSIITNLAEIQKLMGRFSEAEPLYDKSLDFSGKLYGKQSQMYAGVLTQLASLYMRTQRMEKAAQNYLESLAIVEKIYGKNHVNYALVVNNLAVLYMQNKNYPKAEKLYEETINISKIEKNREYYNSLNNLANLYMEQKKYEPAKKLLIECEKELKKIVGVLHNSYIRCIKSLGETYFYLGDYTNAKKYLMDMSIFKLKEMSDNFGFLSESQKLTYLEENRKYFETFSSFAFSYSYINKNQNDKQAVLNTLYSLFTAQKGIVFNSNKKIVQEIMSSGNADMINKYNNWKEQKEQLAHYSNLTSEELNQKGINIKELRIGTENVEKLINLQSFERKKKEFSFSSIDEITKKLNVDECLIEIIRIKIDTAITYGFLLANNQGKLDIELGINGKDLEEKFLKYYKNMIKNKSFDKHSYKNYWSPIEKVLKRNGKFKKIFMAADGVYNEINLSSIKIGETEKFVLDEFNIHLLTNTKEILDLEIKKTNSKKEKKTTKTARLFGRPTYQMEGEKHQEHTKQERKTGEEREVTFSENYANVEWNDLPGTETEIKSIEKIMNANNLKVESFYKEKATEEAVKNSKNPTILHIATHGFFFQDEDKTKITNSNETMMRSGIALAGVSNYFRAKEKPNTDDGILTAYEVSNMDLGKTELVVLSACETGLGDITAGEGVFGLQRALRVAGAKTIITSLWTVNDEVTQMLMTEFYSIWFSGISCRDAFNQAQKKIKEKYPEPYFWGAFLMIGE